MERHAGRSNAATLRIIFLTILTGVVLNSCSKDSGRSVELKHNDQLIVMCQGSCDPVANQVLQLNGNVDQRYNSFNALAISLPAKYADRLARSAGVATVRKDETLRRPIPEKNQRIVSNVAPSYRNINTKSAQPNNYSFNNILTGATQLHDQGITGTGVIVAVIDSGTANNVEVVPALAGSVIGGENFVDLPDEPSATSTHNDFHGTAVGSMIAAHVGVVFDNSSEFLQAISTHAPDSVIPVDDTSSMVPMVGSAPDAGLYAMKVFPANGDGTPSSVVLAAMDRALTLKRNYNAGLPSDPISGDGSEDNPYVYDSLNIQVVNLSLGGMGMVAGHEIEELLAREMLKEGINVVTSAGNDGFAALTVGSPATGVANISVGAASTPQHERILRDVILGPGEGNIYRPSNHIQTAFFSSRGPTADGRLGIDVMANGYASFVQPADGGIMLISGTSFSAPTVAGAVALLRQAFPNSTAAQIREALIQGANPTILSDTVLDQGAGFLDLATALQLMSQGLEARIPALPDINEEEPTQVKSNIRHLGITIIDTSEPFQTQVRLQPGQARHILVQTDLGTESVQLDFSNVSMALPKEQQNLYFGDSLWINVADGPVTTNNLKLDELFQEDAQFTITQPQTGLMRLAVLGDWTNAGEVSATLTVTSQQRRLSTPFKTGRLRDDEVDVFELEIDDGDVRQLNFELSWEGDWGQYPPHDIDLIVINPLGEAYFDAATLDAPERLSIDNPMEGDWSIFVTGYMLHGFKDKYELRISDQNGRRLRD
ncbi:MAG: S8 family serine peptidase [Gammaproteobacteria bacterium]|nr:S8 family serine peptidase [Gammaproteobacteria bacterium]MDH5801386.1 S8 family serine peptidase [Gammaproteobacteria bacterium]